MIAKAIQTGYKNSFFTSQNKPASSEDFTNSLSSVYAELNEFASISAVSEVKEGRCDGKVIGLTTIPYENTNISYGMIAQYSPESTPDNPIIRVTSNYKNESISYDIQINQVDPRHASQLEMFALLSYTDDQNISHGGTFGSYNQLKIYGDNASMNGYMEAVDTYDAFLDAKNNWLSLMNQMGADYSKAGIYQQFLNCQKLTEVFLKFIR